ncbi:HDOD domain-containing protein [Nautilia sp.]
MLISEKEICEYLRSVPSVPEKAVNVLKALKKGDIKSAAVLTENNPPLKERIGHIVNSAYFSLPNRVENTLQLFTMIGIETAKSLVYGYMVSLLAPEKWRVFSFDFKDFQAKFLSFYKTYMKIEFGEEAYEKYSEIGAVIPAAVCVCESLLADKSNEVALITDNAPVELGTLIKRMSGYTLFEIAAKIAQIWELEEEKCIIIKKSECNRCEERISALIHFLLFFIVSRPAFMDLNSIMEFNPECMELIPKTTQRIINEYK